VRHGADCRFCGASGQVRKGDGVHVIAETQHVVSRVKDNSGESVHIELCTKPFKMLEIFIPDGGTAFHFNPGAMSVVAAQRQNQSKSISRLSLVIAIAFRKVK
jgi:hypothetical protein